MARPGIPAPLCPADDQLTVWVNLRDPADDTWSCPSCRRFGIVLPKGYLDAHPEENEVLVIGVWAKRLM